MAKQPKITKAIEVINKAFLSDNDVKELTEQLSEKNTEQASKEEQATTEQEQLNSKKRVKLTTMINPTLRDRLKLITIKKNCNLSDVLEDAIQQYLDGQ